MASGYVFTIVLFKNPTCPTCLSIHVGLGFVESFADPIFGGPPPDRCTEARRAAQPIAWVEYTPGTRMKMFSEPQPGASCESELRAFPERKAERKAERRSPKKPSGATGKKGETKNTKSSLGLRRRGICSISPIWAKYVSVEKRGCLERSCLWAKPWVDCLGLHRWRFVFRPPNHEALGAYWGVYAKPQ